MLDKHQFFNGEMFTRDEKKDIIYALERMSMALERECMFMFGSIIMVQYPVGWKYII